MAYIPKSKEEKQAEIKALIDDAQEKINSYFESPESIKEYLDFMSKFYNYSLNNSILIQKQFSGAMAVAPYKTWQDKGFQVNKGEKAIKILVPCKGKERFENENGEIKTLAKATNDEKEKIKKGIYQLHKGATYFMKGNVFDISQTNAKLSDLPKVFPNKWLEGDVKDYKLLRKSLENVADKINVRIIEPKSELGAAKGVSYTNTREVTLNPRNSELQNVKTLLHELTHAKLHTMQTLDKYKTHEKEFQAELTAYTVCEYMGLNTSDYSINYLHSWSKDKTFEDKKQLLKEVHETAKEFISVIDNTLQGQKLEQDNNIQKNDNELNKTYNNEDVKQIDRTKNPIHIFEVKNMDGKSKFFIGKKGKDKVKALSKIDNIENTKSEFKQMNLKNKEIENKDEIKMKKGISLKLQR